MPRLASVSRFAAAALLVMLADVPALAEVPTVRSSDGLTVASQTSLSDRLLELAIDTPSVLGRRKVRVLLPTDYDPAGSKRYPVLYLLHGAGNPNDPSGARDWTDKGDAAAITAGRDVIVVMPDGGNGGWYTDWLFPGEAAPQNWQSFHMGELLPFIDTNFHTISAREGRAIIGLSMGGYGALRYAERYPERFAFVASFSGAVNMLSPGLQRVVFLTELADGKPSDGPFGIGAPLPLIVDRFWREADPVASETFGPSRLRGMGVALYVGSGSAANDPDAQFPTNLEAALNPSSHRFSEALTAAGIEHRFMDYGRGENLEGCSGDHEWGCWRATLRDVMPFMLEKLAPAH